MLRLMLLSLLFISCALKSYDPKEDIAICPDSLNKYGIRPCNCVISVTTIKGKQRYLYLPCAEQNETKSTTTKVRETNAITEF